MADVPGIQFDGSPGVDRAVLPGVGRRPRVQGGYMSWPAADGGSSSASPAHERAYADLSGLSRDDVVRWVWEGLEVPGTASDYHFLLQGAVEQAWSRRREDPAWLHALETFAYLDLALVEAAPHAVTLEGALPAGEFVRIASIERLLTLLEREGALREAGALAHRAQRFGEHYWRDELEAKVAALDGELQ
jgi:hypothetical protein